METKIRIAVVLIISLFVLLLVFQIRWLADSYKISTQKTEQDIKAILDKAIVEHENNAANEARELLTRLLAADKDIQIKELDYEDGRVNVGFNYRNHAYTAYYVNKSKLPEIKKNPSDFLVKQMRTENLYELWPIYSSLFGVRDYDSTSNEYKMQGRLMSLFDLHKDTIALKKIIQRELKAERIIAPFSLKFYNTAEQAINTEAGKYPHSLKDTAEVTLTRPELANDLQLLEDYSRDKMQRTLVFAATSNIIVAKPILDNYINIFRGQIPVILLKAQISRNVILKNMRANILSSFTLLMVMMFCVGYMLIVIIKQKKLSEIKNDFISNISHELKTPIATATAAIQGMQHFDVLKDEAKTKQYLGTAYNELQRLGLMVNKILNMSVFESNDYVLNKTKFDLKSMLEEIIAAQQIRNEKSVDISFHFTGPEMIKGDRAHLHNVLVNLVDNAIKYSGERVEVAIDCVNDSNYSILTIKDNGMGIAPEYHRTVFEKFFRVSSNTGHQVKGYGLGLSYVKNIIEKHGGTVTLQSQLNKGTTFIITLPQA